MLQRLLTLTLALLALAPAALSQTHVWDTAIDGDWDTPGRWSAGTTPNDPGHWAAIGVEGAAYKVTMDINVLLDRLSLTSGSLTLEMINKALTVGNPFTIDNSTVNMINGTFNGGGQFTNRSQVYARGSTSIENLYNDGILDVIGSPSGSTSNLTLVAPAYSEGTINVTSEGGGYGSNLKTATGTTLSNFGTLNFQTGAGGSRSFVGALENNFLVAIGEDTTFTTGPISNLQNTFHVFPTHTATFSNNTDFNMEGGILVNDGTFRMSNSAFTWNGGELQNRALDLVNNTFTIGVNNLALGAVRLHGASNLTGTLRSGQVLYVNGSSLGSTANLAWQGTGEQFSFGAIHVSSQDGGYQSELSVVPGAKLKNNGTITFYEGAGGTRYFDGDIFNDISGQITFQTNVRMQAGPIENKGHWEIIDTKLMDFNNSMTWRQTDGTLQVDGEFKHFNGTDEFLGGNVVGPIELVNSNLTLDSAFTGTFEAVVQGSSNLTGDLENGQTMYVRGSASGSTANLNLTGSTENRGTLIVDSTSGGYASNFGTADVAFTNKGNLQVNPGTGGTRSLRGDITNDAAGSLTIDTNTVMVDGPIVNEGSWTINSGDGMTFNNSMEFRQNSGTLQIDGTFVHVNGTDVFDGGTVNGLVEVVNSNLTLGPAFVDPVTLLVEGSSLLTGDLESGQTLYARGAAIGSTGNLGFSGAFENRGTMILDSLGGGYQSNMGSADVALLNTGTLTVEPGAGGGRVIRGDLTNDGTLQLNATTRLEDGPILNNGSFNVASGVTVDFGNSMTFEQLNGTLQIDGTFKHVNGIDRFAGGLINGTPRLVNSNLTLEPSFTTPIEIDLMGSSKLTGDLESGQLLRVKGSALGSTGTTTVQAPMTNRGIIEVVSESGGYQSTLSAPVGQGMTNEGTISTLSGSGGNRTLSMVVDNHGLIDLQVGTTVGFSGADHQNAGTFEVHSNSTIHGTSFTNLDGGRFESEASITNNITPMHNDGIWAMGFGIGSMHMTGSWSQGSTGKLEIELGGLTAATEYDQMTMSGTATLDGEVMLKAANGYDPKFGDQFVILICNSTSGDFTGVTYDGNLPLGYGFQLVNTGTTVIAQVVQVIVDAGNGSTVDVTLSGPVPGQAGRNNHFQVNGLTGNGTFAIVYGTATGTTPTGICASDFGIDSAAQLGTGIASAEGVGLITTMVPAAASGVTAYFQALDVERCELSSVNSFQFP